MTNTSRIYNILRNDHDFVYEYDDHVPWRGLRLKYVSSNESAWNWISEPISFSLTEQPRLSDSYHKENLDMLFGLEGG